MNRRSFIASIPSLALLVKAFAAKPVTEIEPMKSTVPDARPLPVDPVVSIRHERKLYDENGACVGVAYWDQW